MAFTSGYKVNEGTQYEFTVSNETISEMVQQDGGITNADIQAYCYSALIDSRINTLIAASNTTRANPNFDAWFMEHIPYYFPHNDDDLFPVPNIDLTANADTVYERNFLIWSGTIYPGTADEKTGHFLVMDIADIKKWYVDFSSAGFGQTSVTSEMTKQGQPSEPYDGYTGDCYYYEHTGALPVIYPVGDDVDDIEHDLYVRNVLNINDEYWIGRLNPGSKGDDVIMHAYFTYQTFTQLYIKGLFDSADPNNMYYQCGSIDFAGVPKILNHNYPFYDGGNAYFKSYAESLNGVIFDVSGNYGNLNYWNVETYAATHAKDLNTILTWQSWCGLLFKYNNTMYKPIIEQGVIVGYSSDMSEPSEWDDMTNVTGNNISPTPPGPAPGPSGDDPWHGIDFGGTGAGGGGAFCSVYYMTAAQLTSLKNWSNTSAPEGFDMLPSIIGLQQLPVEVTGAPTTVKFLKSGAITQQGESRVINTEVPAGTGTGQPISFSLGSVDISRRMQQRGEPYLDYDCTIELFLPFAGTFVLDTQAVMGRTINAEIVIDPVNGTAFAYAWVSQGGQKMPIAYGSSSIAVDLPIASNQWGISRAAFKQASHQMTMNAIKDIGNFIIGAGTYKTGQSGAIADRSGFASLSIQEGMQAKQIGSQMMTSSTINAATDTASAIVNAHQLNNTNYTAVNGSFGGSYAEWSQPFTAYVRITRPKFKKPSNFNHTQAVPCVETKKLSACTGLTICINPDCGAIPCTEAEKLMITQALVGGVYAGR